MGLLDDAIRDHLDLKRRRGADPAEVERAEREALGPVRRNPSTAEAELAEDQAGPGGAFAYDQAEEEGWSHDSLQEPADGEPLYEEALPAEPAYEEQAPAQSVYREPPPAETGHRERPPADTGYREPSPADTGYREPSPADTGYREPPPADTGYREPPPRPVEPPPDFPADSEPAPETPPAAHPSARPLTDLGGGETQEYNVEEFLAAQEEGEAAAGDDMLEETPEFLQDTPDHDRLWFEQRPPKDFDFDE